MKVEFMISQPK